MTISTSKPFALAPHWPSLPANVGALTTTRRGGVSQAPYDDGEGGGGFNLGLHVGDDERAVRANRAALGALLPSEPAWINQVHGAAVADAAARRDGEPAPVADASVADRAGVVCAVLTADCLPVLFADRAGTMVGAAHAGWRGLAAGVLQETVAAMRGRGAADITAWLGPAIGPRQFEVGADVLEAFVDQAAADGRVQARACFVARPGHPGKYLADIFGLARLALARAGVTDVWGGEHCTVTERGTFYSYRRDKVTGREATLIWLR
ncbi:MAG TPA: peptidoglycan editing factor PgeF [Telluria sp.]|nr:peptidoglycan editing factor PgeF [Telluria sp.]